MTYPVRRTRARAALLLAGLLLALPRASLGAPAGTGTFGIDVDVDFPFTSGTFTGTITSFDAGPFVVGSANVDLATAIGSMSIVNGTIPAINIPALSATFTFDAADQGATSNALDFSGAGYAICTDAITCVEGQGTFVGDVTGIVDPDDVLPDGFVYTFDGTVAVDPGPFDAAGVFGLNAFAPKDVPASAGQPAMVSSDPTTFFDSRKNTLRDFLVELTFAEVTNPGTVTFLGKSAVPGALPANIAVDADESVFVDIVTGDGFAFTPPVDVCVAYDDVDMDGVVDGTSLLVVQLRLLHALALGDNFQDVTTTVGGGKVCGQVGTLSPFVVAAGEPPVTTTTTTTLVTITTTSTTTTTLPEFLPGKKLLLKDKDGAPQKRKLALLAKGGVTLGAGNGTGDDPVVNGATLRVLGQGIDDTYVLPATNWKYLGKEGQGKGYKFKGGTDVKTVIVKNGKLVKAVGKGAGLGHSLGTDPQPVTITLRLGGRAYCMEFGGTVKFVELKKFIAKDTPAPTTPCSPSGAFVD